MVMDLEFAGKAGVCYFQAMAGKNTAVKNEEQKTGDGDDFWQRVSARAARAAELERRQFAEEQKAKKLRRAYYARINEESALKRKLQEMENNRMYYQESVRALPLSSTYQKRVREAMACASSVMITDRMGTGTGLK